MELTRRYWSIAAAAIGAAVMVIGPRAYAQGRCMLTAGTPACNTASISPVFEPTGWKTVALVQITFAVADPRSEAAFYSTLMGWTLRDSDAQRALLDIGDWGSVIFKQGTGRVAVVQSFGFVIEPWNAAKVEAELKKRGLDPVADNDGHGFESFHVKDPDGFDVQISNGNGLAKNRRTTRPALPAQADFASPGWKTVWLDHLSYTVTNYKKSTSFYTNLLGWTPTYDEGSQVECLIGDVGDIIIRGGNPLDPNFGSRARSATVDHISFGIAPWDTDGVKAELEKRGLRAQVDTSSRHQSPDGTWVPDDIHTAAFKSYHTQTPNAYNLQISYVTHDNRLALSNAVRPKGGGHDHD
jgi:catechol 2,3-dioxygenase-like lactoylglutathione lyase family enzyme